MEKSPTPDPDRGLKLSRVVAVNANIDPSPDGARYGLERLLDGKLPKDGWRSAWTAWYQKDPIVTFDLGEKKKIGAIRIYFQAWAREDELKSIEVSVSLDGSEFHPVNEYGGIVMWTEKEPKWRWIYERIRQGTSKSIFSRMGAPMGRGRVLGTH